MPLPRPDRRDAGATAPRIVCERGIVKLYNRAVYHARAGDAKERTMSDSLGPEYGRARRLPRRRVLRGAALGAAGIGLAACATPAATTNPPAPVVPTAAPA